jgi:DNA-binding NtrC family response regulator
VRELRQTLVRATVLRQHPHGIEASDLWFEGMAPGGGGAEAPALAPLPGGGHTMQEIERAAIVAELARQRGNRKAAARALGVSRSTLHRRLHTFDIGPNEPGACAAKPAACRAPSGRSEDRSEGGRRG